MTTLSVLALVLLAAAAWLGRLKWQRRRADRAIETLLAAIAEYFSRSGANVGARCLAIDPGRGYTVLIESEPLKRFRYSHIVEASLIDHVLKKTGLRIDKVYWRFPLSSAPAAVAQTAPGSAAPRLDEYAAEGMSRLRSKHEYTVAEESWGEFERALNPDTETPPEVTGKKQG